MQRDLLFTPVDAPSSAQRVRFEATQFLSLGLFLAFLGTGIAKLASTDFVLATFPGWPAPAWTLMVIGLLEIAAAVLTVLPTTRLIGAAALAMLMVGAMTYHAVVGEAVQMGVPASGALLALVVIRLELSLRQGDQERSAAPVVSRSR